MLNIISIVLQIGGFAGLIYGYIKKNRNIMLASSILLWFGASLGDIVHGYITGFYDGLRGVN